MDRVAESFWPFEKKNIFLAPIIAFLNLGVNNTTRAKTAFFMNN